MYQRMAAIISAQKVVDSAGRAQLILQRQVYLFHKVIEGIDCLDRRLSVHGLRWFDGLPESVDFNLSRFDESPFVVALNNLLSPEVAAALVRGFSLSRAIPLGYVAQNLVEAEFMTMLWRECARQARLLAVPVESDALAVACA